MLTYSFELNGVKHTINKHGREMGTSLKIDYAFVYFLDGYKTLPLGKLKKTSDYNFIVYRRVRNRKYYQEWKDMGSTRQIEVRRGKICNR